MATQHKNRINHSRHYWHGHVKAQQESGLSRAEYCRQQNLSYHALTYWQKKLGRSSPPSTALVPVPAEKIPGLPMSNQGAGVKIILHNTVAIEVTEQFSPLALQRVLSVLEKR